MSVAPDIDWETEYNNRARVPEYPEIMAGWERDAAAYREARSDRSELGRSYGPHPRQFLDIFHPDKGEASRPVVVFIHGGYWRSLEPRLFSHLAAGANRHGLVVAMPGYRLCPEVTVPDVIADLQAACLQLHRRFGRPLVACGHSAGGHLAAAMAATDWRAIAPDAPENLVRQAVAVSGLFDLAPLIKTSINESLRLDEVTARAASPAFWPVPAGVTVECWVGETESPEYFRQSRSLAERWAEVGARMHVETLPGLNHFTAPAPLAEPDSDLTQALVALCNAIAGQA
ncbi:MAG: alpha/beta hydrolase [Pseudomonadota bacterium]|nr:alpha/beta hydrolase [Pseudomonadota bacterium]